jgi:N-acetylglutamate synthase/N-acetylornithine aminotransferase
MDFNRKRLSEEIKEAEVVHILVNLGLGDKCARAWSGDLSYEYIKINAEYN